MLRFPLFFAIVLIPLSGCVTATATNNISLIESLRGSTYPDVQARLGNPSNIYFRGPVERCEVALSERRQRASNSGLDPENVEAMARILRGLRPQQQSELDRDCDQSGHWESFARRAYDGTEFVAVYLTDSRRQISRPATATTRIFGNTAYTTFSPGYSGEIGGLCFVRLLFAETRLIEIRHSGNGCE